MPFFLMSSLFLKNNVCNIKYMAVLNFQKTPRSKKNGYNPTGSSCLVRFYLHIAAIFSTSFCLSMRTGQQVEQCTPFTLS
jgi:hypothetical protein